MSATKPAKNHPWNQWRPGFLAAKPGSRPLSTEPRPSGTVRKGARING